MSVYHVNQATQFYVATARNTSNKVTSADNAGTMRVYGDNGQSACKKFAYLEYKGATSLLRSDLIQKENIISVTSKSAKTMATPLKSYLVQLDSNVNSGNPINGQDYILPIHLRQFIGMSDEDQHYIYGMVHATSTMDVDGFCKEMVNSLKLNVKKYIWPLFNFNAVKVVAMTANTGVSAYLYTPTTTTTKIQFAVAAASEGVAESSGTYTISMTAAAKTLGDAKRILANSSYGNVIALIGADSTTMKAEDAAITISGNTSLNGISIVEAPQDWVLGTKAQVPVLFDIQMRKVKTTNGEATWGVITKTSDAGVLNNGKKVADLEYFCMGERGDIYRNLGWPRSIRTKYLVNSDNAYHLVNIHYAFTDGNENVHKSEKDIMIACSTTAVMNNIIDDLETVLGITIDAVAD